MHEDQGQLALETKRQGSTKLGQMEALDSKPSADLEKVAEDPIALACMTTRGVPMLIVQKEWIHMETRHSLLAM
jgi:hypothetical protein